MRFWLESVLLHGWFRKRFKMICWLSARLFDVNQDAASLFEFNQIFTFGDFAELPSPTRQLPAGVQFNQSALPSLSSILSWADNHVGNKLKADYNIVSWHSFSLLYSLPSILIGRQIEIGFLLFLVVWINCRPNQACKSAAVLDVFSRSSFCTIPALASVCSARDRQNSLSSPDLTFTSFFEGGLQIFCSY